MTGQSTDAAAFIRRSDALYREFASQARRDHARGRVEPAVRGVQNAARLACFAHSGRFADGRLENLLLEIGRARVPSRPGAQPDARGETRVLHVATRLLATGGHTRLLLNWIRQDGARRHSLVVVDQPETEIPAIIRATVEAAGGTMTVLPRPGRDPVGAAVALRGIAESSADVVMLHTHQFDVVPLLAFASDGGPPVALVNHSDHTFWLGAGIADVVVPFRQFGQRLGDRRFARRQHLVPLPLHLHHDVTDRAEARRRLGLGDDDVALLTIGARYKYEPTATHDFFARAASILESDHHIHLFAVGMTEAELPASAAPLRGSGRAHFPGVVPEPALYWAAADIYLEGFPLGSLTALLEAAACGVAPILMHDPTPQLDISDDAGLRGLVTGARGAAEYEQSVLSLSADPDRRTSLGAQVRRAVVDTHSGCRWRASVDALLSSLEGTSHCAMSLPDTGAEFGPADIDRATWDASNLSSTPLGVLAAREQSSIAELVRCLGRSLRVRDTRLSVGHLHAWAGAVKLHVRGAPVE